MINFFTKNVLYFGTYSDSLGDGLNTLKYTYSIAEKNNYRIRLHAHIGVNMNNIVSPFLYEDGIIDKFITYHNEEYSENYFESRFNKKAFEYDEVLLRPIFGEKNKSKIIYEYFKNYGCKIFRTHNDGYEDVFIQNQPSWEFYTGSPRHMSDCVNNNFLDVKKSIFSFIKTEKVAILMPLSTRLEAGLSVNAVEKIIKKLVNKKYTVLLCGDIFTPYDMSENNFYNNSTKEILHRLKNVDNVINLLGMSLNKVCKLSAFCDLFISAPTGAAQMSWYDYIKCKSIMIETGVTKIMTSCYEGHKKRDINIIDCNCEYRYCQYYVELKGTNEKIKNCQKNGPKCLDDELPYNQLEELI